MNRVKLGGALLALVLALVSTGCGRQSFPTSPTERPKIAVRNAFEMQVADQGLEAPASGDSVFTVFDTSWSAENFFGFYQDGKVTTDYKMAVAAEGERYRMRWQYHDQLTGKKRAIFADITANGTLITGRFVTPYNIWYEFYAQPPQDSMGRAKIISRDDRGKMRWDELLITGHDPQPSQFDFDVNPSQAVYWATTTNNLVDQVGIWAEPAWRTPIYSMEGVEFIFRPMYVDGALLRQGVYVRQPDGTQLLCVHLVNVSGSSDPEKQYYMFSIIRGADGRWTNTGPDNRRAVIEFGGNMTRAVGQQLIEQGRVQYDLNHPV